jgi:hypothetical protein
MLERLNNPRYAPYVIVNWTFIDLAFCLGAASGGAALARTESGKRFVIKSQRRYQTKLTKLEMKYCPRQIVQGKELTKKWSQFDKIKAFFYKSTVAIQPSSYQFAVLSFAVFWIIAGQLSPLYLPVAVYVTPASVDYYEECFNKSVPLLKYVTPISEYAARTNVVEIFTDKIRTELVSR